MSDLQYIELIQALLNTCHISNSAMMRLALQLVGEETLASHPILNEWIASLYPVVSHEALSSNPKY